jgi:hypothetical protein
MSQWVLIIHNQKQKRKNKEIIGIKVLKKKAQI